MTWGILFFVCVWLCIGLGLGYLGLEAVNADTDDIDHSVKQNIRANPAAYLAFMALVAPFHVLLALLKWN